MHSYHSGSLRCTISSMKERYSGLRGPGGGFLCYCHYASEMGCAWSIPSLFFFTSAGTITVSCDTAKFAVAPAAALSLVLMISWYRLGRRHYLAGGSRHRQAWFGAHQQLYKHSEMHVLTRQQSGRAAQLLCLEQSNCYHRSAFLCTTENTGRDWVAISVDLRPGYRSRGMWGSRWTNAGMLLDGSHLVHSSQFWIGTTCGTAV